MVKGIVAKMCVRALRSGRSGTVLITAQFTCSVHTASAGAYHFFRTLFGPNACCPLEARHTCHHELKCLCVESQQTLARKSRGDTCAQQNSNVSIAIQSARRGDWNVLEGASQNPSQGDRQAPREHPPRAYRRAWFFETESPQAPAARI